jgi:hypothetical protein
MVKEAVDGDSEIVLATPDTEVPLPARSMEAGRRGDARAHACSCGVVRAQNA